MQNPKKNGTGKKLSNTTATPKEATFQPTKDLPRFTEFELSPTQRRLLSERELFILMLWESRASNPETDYWEHYHFYNKWQALVNEKLEAEMARLETLHSAGEGWKGLN